MKDRYEVVVVWDDGTKQVYGFATLDKANEIARGYSQAFGGQVWVCVREKKGDTTWI